MNIPSKVSVMACLAVCLALACALTVHANAQSDHAQSNLRMGAVAQPAITLDPPTGWELQSHLYNSRGNLLPEAPSNFRRLGEAKVGERADVHSLTLRFNATATLTGMKSTTDFHIEPGGSCAQGNTYQAKTSCTLLVRFTPQGAGSRLGRVSVSTNLSATPMAFGLGGYGYAPAISFTPAMITTLPGSYPASVGLLSGAQNLAVDGSDTLWVADTGNNLVRNYDSSATFKTLASGFSAPWGITVDTFGQAYFSRPAANTINEIYDYGPVIQANGAGTVACPAATPCTLNSHTVVKPGEMSMDPYNHMFFTEQTSGGAFSTVQPTPASLIFLYDPFPYQTVTTGPAAMDASDNIYSFWTSSGNCQLVQQTLYNAENSNAAFTKIAGGHICGFAGDGGPAGNAEMGTSVGQIAFDAAGDLYFSDTANQRVRRIDYATGIISTIAGNGIAGYTGDNAAAPAANLSNPTGVGVDSQGAVYIISSASSGQVIRKVGPLGFLRITDQPKGTASAPAMLTVTNTGNNVMFLTKAAITGTAASDYQIDPNSTSCNLAPGSSLGSGQSCKVGIIFTPSVAGGRLANFVLLNNTVTGSNTTYLWSHGTLPIAKFVITSPTSGQSFSSGTAVPFSVSVTSTTSPAPTGTVQFKVDGANYGGPVTISGGAASTSVTGLTQTSHTLSATYSGDANYAAGGPISVGISVTAVLLGASVSLSPVAQPLSSCSPPQFAVTVSSSNPVPTGNVSLFDGNTNIASGLLVNGRVLLTSPSLSSGSHTLTARYGGDSMHLPAVSPSLIEGGFALLPCHPSVRVGSFSSVPRL
jgi:hypothetical protein